MNISEFVRTLNQNRDCTIVTEKYCIQIYSNGKRGNVKRKNGTVVCAFDIEERIMIAPVKESVPHEFGYTRYGIGMNEEMTILASMHHKDSVEIFEAFIIYMLFVR